MLRTVKVSLKFLTESKQQRLKQLLRERRAMTQRFIDTLWLVPGKLDKATMNRVKSTQLSYRHKSDCLKNALSIIVATKLAAKATGRKASKPRTSGAVAFSSLVAKVEHGKKTFDFVIKLSGLSKGNPICVPVKGHKRLTYWLSKPGAKIVQGCTVGDAWLSFVIHVPDELTKAGDTLGVDIGVHKLLVDSRGQLYGTAIKPLLTKLRRKKPKSKAKRRAQAERKDYINKTCKELPWSTLGKLGVEALNNLKTGKKKGRGKTFRKAIAPWTYRQVVTRITQLAQENRVCLVAVNPRDTSRTCPSCGTVAKENRRGENFKCVKCNYSNDADYVGALNVLARTLENSQQSMVAGSLA